MNTPKSSSLRVGLVFASLLACSAPAVFADDLDDRRTRNAALNTDFSSLRVVDDDDFEEIGFGKLRGHGVKGADGKSLGRVRDFVLDSRRGDVRFAVVGGGLFGGPSRLVPVEALTVDPDDRGYITRLQQYDWQLLPEIAKEDLKSGRLVLSSDHRRNLTRLRDADWVRSYEVLPDGASSADLHRYVLASRITGKSLYNETTTVGEIDDVVIDVERRTAGVLVETDPDFAGDEHDVVIPLRALQLAPGESDRIHTALTAEDFHRAIGTSPDVRRDRVTAVEPRRDSWWARRRAEMRAEDDEGKPRVEPQHDAADRTDVVVTNRIDDQPTPTGRTNAYVDEQAKRRQTLESAARSIQQFWQADPQLAKLNLRANVEDDHLVLEGNVPSADLYERAEDAAEEVVSFIDIKNRLNIRDR